MNHVVVICADGFEEIEALAVVDILRRGHVSVELVSINETPTVIGSHQIQLVADKCFVAADVAAADMIILPGGVAGTENLAHYQPLLDVLTHVEATKKVAAICAAPSVLAQVGLLDHKTATSNPGYMQVLTQHPLTYSQETVVTDGTITTSRGMGTTIPFALNLLEQLTDAATVEQVKQSIVYDSLVDYIKKTEE